MKDKGINLLPVESTGVSEVARLSGLLTRITYIVGILFVAVGVCFGVYILILTTQISEASAEVNTLRTSIEAKQQVEEQYVFVKDRIDKINPIARTDDTLGKFSEMTQAISDPSAVSEGEITEGKFDITYIIRDSSKIADLFSSYIGKGFSQVDLKNFSFSPTVGYLVSLGIILQQ